MSSRSRRDGPVRVVRLNRPEQLNATNHALHEGLAGLFPQIDADDDARAVVLTGNGQAFSAGGDFTYLDELATDAGRRKETLAHGRQIVTGMVGLPGPHRGRRERAGGGPGLQPGRALRHRLHGRERAPGRPPRGSSAWWPPTVAR